MTTITRTYEYKCKMITHKYYINIMSERKMRRASKSLRLIVPIHPDHSKIPIEASLTSSQNEGVPPPIDAPSSISSPSSEVSCTEIEIISMQATTKKISNEIKEAITEYKETNTELMKNYYKTIGESVLATDELNIIRDSLRNALEETKKTKNEFKENLLRVESEVLIDTQNSFMNTGEMPVDAIEELIKLKSAINMMNERLSFTEGKISFKDYENNSLKETVLH